MGWLLASGKLTALTVMMTLWLEPVKPPLPVTPTQPYVMSVGGNAVTVKSGKYA